MPGRLNRPLSFLLLALSLPGCGSGSSGGSPAAVAEPVPVVISGVPADDGNFDPAPATGPDGTLWTSYSHVATADSGLRLVETRLATSADGGLTWQDAGVAVNAPDALPLPPPEDVNAVAHEVSRLAYDPYAEAAGADPWLLVWHRYLSVLEDGATARLFQHGWVGLKSGPAPTALAGERKLFTGSLYDPANDADALGPPEYPLDRLFPEALGDCLAFTEPGVLAKPEGVYVSLVCATASPPNKVVLLRCGHDLDGCTYLGDLVSGDEAAALDPAYDGFSASELVAAADGDYLVVSPTRSPGPVYRGCVAYRIADLAGAEVEREAGAPVPARVVPARGDFNGACGYDGGLTGSGMLMSQAFFLEPPPFRLFATGVRF